jgi:hypothetical protein
LALAGGRQGEEILGGKARGLRDLWGHGDAGGGQVHSHIQNRLSSRAERHSTVSHD